MKSYGIPLQQLFTALGRGNANAGGSYVEQGEQQYLIRGIGLLRSPDDIGKIVVAEHGGTPLLSATSPTSPSAPCRGRASSAGTTTTTSSTGIVLMRKGENPSEVLTAVKETRRAPERVGPAERRRRSCRSTTAPG